MFLDPFSCTAAQIFWFLTSMVWFFKRHDELPLIISTLLAYVFSMRYWALAWGWTEPVNLTGFGFNPISHESTTSVFNYALLGQTVLLTTYMLRQTKNLKARNFRFAPHSGVLIGRLILVLAALTLPVSVWARASVTVQAEAGKSLGFEVSNYMFLFPFALIGVAVLLVAGWKFGAFSGLLEMLLAAIALALIAWSTFGPNSRFQFLGWIIACLIILTSNLSRMIRVQFFLSGGVIGMGLFAVAGAMRTEAVDRTNMGGEAWERFLFASDANMLDGFVLLQQVYPNQLGYRYGREHLEILARPIPRSLWEDKPVGGYMNKLGLIDRDTGYTLGISQSLFGSFYEEGAVAGIVFFSILYGMLFAQIVEWSMRLHPFPGILLRASLCAAVIPLLRGGDLPGIYAWFGMAFWPCLLVVVVHRKLISPRPRSVRGKQYRKPISTLSGIR